MSDTELDIRHRCIERETEKAGRTHKCRLVAKHPGDHACICGRRWETRTEVKK